MKTSRKLTLRSERLAALDTDDLRGIAGAATREDSCHVTWYCATMHYDCPTEPIRVCLSLDRPCIQTD